MPRSRAQRLASAQRRYGRLAAQLADIGLITAGSLTRRYTRCTSLGCRCNAEPPRPHGPYWQWTAKINGKTVTRRLTAAEARLYQEWIDNDRKLRSLIDQMRAAATEATELIMEQVHDAASEV
ncbi:MAG: DUF6788 family protein [Actinomycetota bacterium]